MSDLIKIINENGKQLVSAKELYIGLGLNKSEWPRRWYERNIENNEFFTERVNYLDIIADDKKLIEGYIIIIKEMAIKNNVKWEDN